MKKDIIINDIGGWSSLNVLFSPGWSTGPKNGKHNDGVDISVMFTEKRKFKKNEWSGGGVIQKEQAIKLAKAILKHYGELT